ncbi:class I SAM-dependent methyltransferase [Agromyces sp. H66]|uniref:class I SAM-dependent methyltransferase n=1 Tax=Agromyces sp. H66 TaxID=2529859 RepID=UPI00145B7F26|nr:class I SAM-dependent methyltransferase [Agromyces sp. H66]
MPETHETPSTDAAAWDARYRSAAEAGGREWAAEPHGELRRVAGALAPGRALDLACGDGRNAAWLARRGWSVTAVDFSAEALELARSHAPEGIDWVQADVTGWQPDGDYDLITITYLQLPAPAMRSVLARASTWLAPGGTLIVISHDIENLAAGAPGPKNPAVLHTPELLREAVEGLHIITAERFRRDTVTDPEHPGDHATEAIDTLLIAIC